MPGRAAIRLDPAGTILDWSAAAQHLLGYSPDAVIGHPVALLYPPDDAPEYQAQEDLRQARSHGRHEMMVSRRRADGSLVQARCLILPHGSPAGAAGFALLLQELIEEAGLGASHPASPGNAATSPARPDPRRDDGDRRFRQVVEAAPNAMVMANAEGRIVLVNAQAERVFGYDRAEMLGEPVEMLLPERFRRHHPQLRRSFAAAPSPRPMGVGRDLNGRRKDGSEFPLEIGLNPIETDDGPMVLSSILDMSARVQLESQLRQAQKMEAVGRLTAGVAHDFNNLLQAMMGSLELLLDRVGCDEGAAALAAACIDATQRGARLTHHLLAFSRTQVLRPSQIEITKLLRQTVEMLRRTLDPAIQLDVATDHGDLWAFADASQLEACILNLALNARDAMPQGGRLVIRAQPRMIEAAEATGTLRVGAYVMISVEDSGAGIAAELLDKIFEPFFTTKPIGKGSGLGLPMVLGFAHQSGGDIRIFSRLGHGTRFEVFLPFRSDRPGLAGTSAAGKVPMPAGQGRLLLVDDDAAVLRTVSATLTGAGYAVTATTKPAEALQIIANGAHFDGMIADFAMPGMSGAELLARVAEIRPGMPMLVVSGYTVLDQIAALPLRIEILRKPFLRADLLREVAGLLKPGIAKRDMH